MSATPLPFHEVLRARMDTLGRLVREAWVQWAMEQPDPKPSWLVPYDELSPADQEADRQIGQAVWSVAYLTGFNDGMQAAYNISHGKPPGARSE